MKAVLKLSHIVSGFLLVLATIAGQFAFAQQQYTWGGYGSGEGQFKYPREVAVDASDNVYVVDGGNNRIQVFNSNGEFLSQLGTGTVGSADGEFNFPTDVAVDDAGNVYVVDTGNVRIQMFDSNGFFVASWGGSYGVNDNQFTAAPGAIAVDAQGNYVYVAAGHFVYKFAITGNGIFEWVGQFGGYGPNGEPGLLSCGCDLALDVAGNVYVSEAGNKRVQKFDGDGNWIATYSYPGVTPQATINPLSVALDQSGNIYVLDNGTGFNRFVKLDSSGAYIEYTQVVATSITGMAIDQNDTVYITDVLGHRLVVVPGIEDMDSDGIADADDNCLMVANPDQLDSDGDLIGNACDDDDDNDTVPDVSDNCPLVVNVGQENADGDSMGDACDPDADNDGIDNQYDQCPLVSGAGSTLNNGCPDDVAGLITWLHGSVDTGNLRSSLGAKLEAAMNARHPLVAAHQLNAFINQVSAQSGKKISAEDAGAMINMANNVIRGL